MRWPGGVNAYYEVRLTRNFSGDIVQTDARFQDRGGGLFELVVEERATRPDVYSHTYGFRTRNQLVNPLKERNFSSFTIQELANRFTTSNVASSSITTFNIKPTKFYDSENNKDADVIYDTVVKCKVSPLITDELPLPVDTTGVCNPIEPNIALLPG
jgi:hypothetical protein